MAKSQGSYEAVIDQAALRGWTCRLSKGRNGWQLDVLDDGELIARGRSRQSPPDCFRRLGNIVSLALERSGKFSE